MNTKYTITVQAYNEKGHGPASVPIYVTTSDGSKFLLLFKYTPNGDNIILFTKFRELSDFHWKKEIEQKTRFSSSTIAK